MSRGEQKNPDTEPIILCVGTAFDWAGSQGIECLRRQVGEIAAESVRPILLATSLYDRESSNERSR